jgi:hypothetical protein
VIRVPPERLLLAVADLMRRQRARRNGGRGRRT